MGAVRRSVLARLRHIMALSTPRRHIRIGQPVRLMLEVATWWTELKHPDMGEDRRRIAGAARGDVGEVHGTGSPPIHRDVDLHDWRHASLIHF
jgi:hypothetical protein